MTSSISQSPAKLNATARSALLSLTEEHVTGIVRDALAIQRHSKRARLDTALTVPSKSGAQSQQRIVRRRLHANDVNMALQMRGSEKLYGTPLVSSEDAATAHKKSIDLANFLRREPEIIEVPPSEVKAAVHWLAVDGDQPESALDDFIPVPFEDAPSNALNNVDGTASSSLLVEQLQASLVSEDLQLYFKRATLAMERGSDTDFDFEQQNTIIRSVAKDPGLQELVPFFIRYVQQQVYQYMSNNSERCRALLLIAQALLRNPHLHLELYLHELLPVLITSVVAKYGQEFPLRTTGAYSLALACRKFGDEYPTLRARILKKLCEGLESSPTPTCFGSMSAITYFGPKAVDSFLLPFVFKQWPSWKNNSSPAARMCQHAALCAVGSFLARVDVTEQALRADWNDLRECFGDQLTPVQGQNEDVYAMCFI